MYLSSFHTSAAPPLYRHSLLLLVHDFVARTRSHVIKFCMRWYWRLKSESRIGLLPVDSFLLHPSLLKSLHDSFLMPRTTKAPDFAVRQRNYQGYQSAFLLLAPFPHLRETNLVQSRA